MPDHISRLPGYVNASPVLDGIDEFDAEFFGFSARDASLTDPQHRLFLETAWEALEDAGYDPARFPGAIGVFGGCELSSYLDQLYQNIDSLKYIDGMQLMVTNDKDHLCTQVSYRLNLRGPSVVVQTTCSTSLVAVSLACESLHARPLRHGSRRRRDGARAAARRLLLHRRVDPVARRALPALRRQGAGHDRRQRRGARRAASGSADAVAAGDNIRARHPRRRDQQRRQRQGRLHRAQLSRPGGGHPRRTRRMAGISAESIGYVEAHGTGTILGDPIEVSALTEVFKANPRIGAGSAASAR